MIIGAVVLFPYGIVGALARGARRLKRTRPMSVPDRTPARELAASLEAKS